MDAKITRQRLSRMLAYDWLKILGIIAGVILIWSIVFTMTATRITPSQQFTVFNHYANQGLQGTSFYDHYDKTIENGVFSYEIMETGAVDLATTEESYIFTICDTRFSTGEGDLIFLPHIADASLAETELKDMKYTETFYARYASMITDWETYLADARTYLNTYFNGDYVSGELDERKAERDFRATVNATRDKRFRRESKLLQGIQDEFLRLEKYRAELLRFEGYLSNGVVALQSVSYTDGENTSQGNYALNLCPNETTMSKLKDYVCYSVTGDDGKSKASAKDMCVMLLDLPGMNKDYQYETLLYVNDVIKQAYTPTAA